MESYLEEKSLPRQQQHGEFPTEVILGKDQRFTQPSILGVLVRHSKKIEIRGMEYVNLLLAYLRIFWQHVTGNLLIHSYIISRLTAINSLSVHEMI